MTLCAGAECSKDFFTSTLHNLVVSCAAVPNSPDKAVYITVIVLPHAYMHGYMFVFRTSFVSANAHGESHIHVQVI